MIDVAFTFLKIKDRKAKKLEGSSTDEECERFEWNLRISRYISET